MFLSKLKALSLTLPFIFSLEAYAQKMPQSFKDFHVYTTHGIDYAYSDFQGIVGSGGTVNLQNFSVLDDRTQLGGFKNPFSYSVFSNDFALYSGAIMRGGVYAKNNLTLISASVEGVISAKKAVVKNSGFKSRTKSVPNLNFVNIQNELYRFAHKTSLAYGSNPQIENLYFGERLIGQYQVFRASQNDGKLMNVFEVNRLRNFAIDSNGDSREYFIIIDRSETVDLSYIDVKLLDGVSPTKILYLFPNAKRILFKNTGVSSLSGREVGLGLPGTIVAPHATVDFVDGLLTGSIYVKKLNGTAETTGFNLPGGQINYAPFVCFTSENCRDLSDINYN